MKIIKKAQANWTHQFTCSECETELEANQDDLKYKNYPGDMSDSGFDNWNVSCPICSHVTNIKEDKIPKVIRVLKKLPPRGGGGGYYDR